MTPCTKEGRQALPLLRRGGCHPSELLRVRCRQRTGGRVREAVIAQVRTWLCTPEIIARVWAAARPESEVPEREVVEIVTAFAPLWDELFPAEQARVLRLLVERVELSTDGITVRLRAEGLQTLVAELRRREAA